MQIELEAEAEAILRRLLQSGKFATPPEAVADALRRAKHEQRLAWLRARVEEALADGTEGTMEDLDRELEEARSRYGSEQH